MKIGASTLAGLEEVFEKTLNLIESLGIEYAELVHQFPTENIDVVNLKCDPLMNVVTEDGIFPAYHMSKTHWISVVLDGSVDEDKIKWLLNLSFELTGRVK